MESIDEVREGKQGEVFRQRHCDRKSAGIDSYPPSHFVER
jgi:hypothetical protein